MTKESVKFLYFTMKNGDIYRCPISVIASNRAMYYAEKDESTTYQEEYDFLMGDASEVTDWYFNNMNPKDLGDFVVLVEEAPKQSFYDSDVDDYEVRE